MSKFRYVRPKSLEDAVSYLHEPEFINVPLAGGTDLLVAFRNTDQQGQRFVDISRLQELRAICRNENEITLGAGLTFREIINSSVLMETVPFLVRACSQIGGPQIRNRATVGGNVVNAAICADSLPVLICLEAEVHLKSMLSSRQVPVENFVLGNKKTQIQLGDLLTHFTFKIPPEGTRTSFIKLTRRATQATSRVTVAVLGHLDSNGYVDLIRIVPGAVSSPIERSRAAENYLLQKRPSPEDFHICGQLAAEQILVGNGRRWSTEYKFPVLARLIERVLTEVFLPITAALVGAGQ